MTREKLKREECMEGSLNTGTNRENIDKIASNEDLLTQILLRVPTKSLKNTIRFVSKSWLTLTSDLTSDPNFCYKHNALNPKVASIIYYYDDHNLMSLSLDGHKSRPSLSFLQREVYRNRFNFEDSCNGLILCAGFPTSSQYSVCNLTTRKINIIPKLDQTNNNSKIVCLAFDPVKSPYHKVVMFEIDYRAYGVDIYSSETKSWRHVNMSTQVFPLRKRIYWDGSIHWLKSSGKHLEFDVDREILKENPSPNIKADEYCFGECNGNLLLVLYQPSNQWVSINEMKQGTRNWVLKRWVNLKKLYDIHLERPLFHVRSVIKGSSSEEDDTVLVLATASRYFSFNLRTKALQVLAKSSEEYSRSSNEVHSYNRSPWCPFFENLYPV